MFEIIPKNTTIDFIGKRKLWIALSIIGVLGSLALILTKGLNYGIDFTGGAEVQIKFKNPTTISDVRSSLQNADFRNLTIQQLGESSLNEFLVKVHGDEADLQRISQKTESTLSQKYSKDTFEVQRIDVVGPQAGKELRKSGFLSIFYALLCILIYVAIRFDYKFAPGAVVALIHDSMLTMGIFVLTQKEFSLQIVAAILTIIGYSNNDTIIVYDRIRETMKLFPNRSIEENINRSINETLSRTILTSLATSLVVIGLMVFGGGVIHDFAFTMLIGIVVGTYSSIFIASPVLIVISNFQNRKNKSPTTRTSMHKGPPLTTT